MPRRLVSSLVLACLALAAVPALAEQPPIVRLRIESVDAATETLASVGVPGGSRAVLGPLADQLGLGELAWIDGRRPAAVVLPFAGMTAGAGGVVAVLPYAGERGAALDALGASFDEVTESDGVHRLVRDGGAALALLAGDGWFVIGSNAALLRQVDVRAALAPGDLPPGPAALEVELEAVAPIIQLGLMQGRQMMTQQMAASGEAQSVPPELLDVYFDGIRDLVANTSRLQMSIDTAGERLAWRTRVVPRGGSTLAGVAAAQRGGLPALLEQIDADGAHLLYAGQITFTEALDEALAGYTAAYTNALENLLPMLEQSGAAGSGGLDAVLELLGPEAIAEWQACRAGQYAGRMDLGAEMEMRMVQLSRLRDADECLAIAGRFGERAKRLSDAELPISITPGALVHRGAQAFRIDFDLDALSGDGMSSAAAAELASGMSQFFGFAGPTAITTIGPDGETRFKAAVDRALDGRKAGDGRMASATDFAPLEPAAGMLISVDLGPIAAALPDDGGGAAATIAGRLVAGMRFVGGRVDLDVSLPLSALEALRSGSASEQTAEAPAAASGSAR